jgi:hypothetical protein
MPMDASAIETRIVALEAEVREPKKRTNTSSPKFWTRAFAILGHQFAILEIFYPSVRRRGRRRSRRQLVDGIRT